MTPSGRENYGDVSSYLDGVPVKISERYRPPRKVVLPTGFQNRLDATVQNALRDSSFDFTFCRNVLESSKKAQEEKVALREARKVRIAAEEERQKAERDRALAEQIETFTLQAESLTAAVEASSLPSLPSPPPSPVPVLEAKATKSDFSSILTPLPMPAPTKTISTPVKNTFNISDFEADTSSPFDNMELKTINDMEELAHVLQPNCVTLTKEEVKPSLNYYPQSSYNSMPAAKSAYGAYPSNEPSFNYNFPQQQTSYYYPSQHQQPQQSYMYQGQNTLNYPYAQPNYPTDNNTYPAQSYSQCVHSTTQDLKTRSSKSVPDIMEELQREATSSVPVPKPLQFNNLPPPRPASIGSTGLENWKPWPELDSPEPPGRPVLPPRITKAPLDPFAKLPDSCKQLARQLSEMGFPIDRVARACETVGQDQKKVLDYLLLVQSIESKGFRGSHVELAIGKLGLDETKALKFLPAFDKLVDLGFSQDNASRALVKADFDRDKALEALLS